MHMFLSSPLLKFKKFFFSFTLAAVFAVNSAAAREADLFLQLPSVAPPVAVAGDTSGSLHIQSMTLDNWIDKDVTPTAGTYSAGQSIGGWIHVAAFFKYPGDYLATIKIFQLKANTTTVNTGAPLYVYSFPSGYTPSAGECADGSTITAPNTTGEAIHLLTSSFTNGTWNTAVPSGSGQVYYAGTVNVVALNTSLAGGVASVTGDTDLWACFNSAGSSVYSASTAGTITVSFRKGH